MTMQETATSKEAPPAPAAPTPAPAPTGPTAPAPHPAAVHAKKKRLWIRIVAGVVILGLLIAAIPWIIYSLNTVSTDDAYVNGHVTFVAPRISGQVTRVLVDDNNRVHKGDLLVQIDKEPYQVQYNIAKSAVVTAQADLVTAQAQTRATEGQIRSLRFSLDHAIEAVDDQIAQLRSAVASLQSQKAILTKTQLDYNRAVPLIKSGAVSQEDFDARTEAMLVAQAQVEEALQHVYELRVALGLPSKPTAGVDLAEVPPDLDQTFSTVREAQASLAQAAAQLGVFEPFSITPMEMIAEFYKRDPQGNIDRIYAVLLKSAPAVKQAEAKLAQAQRDLDQAALNLFYTDVVSEIDGVVTRRDVNPGNNVIAGQSLMAVRSLTEIWVDANFKETQLADLRIGQSVDLDVDMYGSRHRFHGRITGFTEGTGSTLALLPAENATGNFVKVVQRLPVRIDLTDYDPDKIPIFIGLSVTPYVHINEPPEGLAAGKVLQPYLQTTTAPSPESATQPSIVQ
jgi:membrane fusion protein, multidrug efflux system